MNINKSFERALHLIHNNDYTAAIPYLQNICQHTQPIFSTKDNQFLLPWTTLEHLLQTIIDAPTIWQRDLFLESHLLLSICHKEMGNLIEAIKALENLAVKYPPISVILALLGRYYYLNDEPLKALNTLTGLIQIEPYQSEVYADLACIANELGNHEEALQFLQIGMDMAPNTVLYQELLHALAQIPEQLLPVFIQLCIQFCSPTTFPYLLKITRSLFTQKKYPLVQTITTALLKIEPQHAECRDLFVMATLQNNQPLIAIHHLWNQLEQNLWNQLEQTQENAGLWYRIACCFQRTNMILMARHAFNQCMMLAKEENIKRLAIEKLQALSQEVSLDACFHEILRMATITPRFAAELQADSAETLTKYGIEWNQELVKLLNKVNLEIFIQRDNEEGGIYNGFDHPSG